VEWSGVEWSGVEWSGAGWSGVEWSGVEWSVLNLRGNTDFGILFIFRHCIAKSSY
jgi:hypothetical protein